MPSRVRFSLFKALFHQNLRGGVHDGLGELDDFGGNGGGEQSDLAVGRNQLDDFVDLLQESHPEHFVGLVDDQHPQVGRVEDLPVHHVADPAGGSHDDVHAVLQALLVLGHLGAAGAQVDLGLQVNSQSLDHLEDLDGQLPGRGDDEPLNFEVIEVDVLQETDREGGCLLLNSRLNQTGPGRWCPSSTSRA